MRCPAVVIAPTQGGSLKLVVDFGESSIVIA